MKKALTFMSVLATAVLCTACGDKMNDNPDSNGTSHYKDYDYGNKNYDNSKSDSGIVSDVKDAIDDVEDAGENIITDVSSAVSDIMDGNDDTTTAVTVTEQ